MNSVTDAFQCARAYEAGIGPRHEMDVLKTFPLNEIDDIDRADPHARERPGHARFDRRRLSGMLISLSWWRCRRRPTSHAMRSRTAT